jgi:hypothetical protein
MPLPPGNWFSITVRVAQAGLYRADLLYTSNRGGTISMDVNGKRRDRSTNHRFYLQRFRFHSPGSVHPT